MDQLNRNTNDTTFTILVHKLILIWYNSTCAKIETKKNNTLLNTKYKSILLFSIVNIYQRSKKKPANDINAKKIYVAKFMIRKINKKVILK